MIESNQNEMNLKLIKSENQLFSYVSIQSKVAVVPGQTVRLDVKSSSEKRCILSPTTELLKMGLMLLNSGQVFEAGEEIFVFIHNPSPATITLQSKERGGFPDLSIWNDAGSVLLEENFEVCLIKEI